MQVSEVKRWQWAIIGVVVGAAIGYMRGSSEPDADLRLSQAEFEMLVNQTNDGTNPIVNHLVVHAPELDGQSPPQKIQPVTGTRLMGIPDKDPTKDVVDGKFTGKTVEVPFVYLAPVPYVLDSGGPGGRRARGGAGNNNREFADVNAYLAEVRTRMPALKTGASWAGTPNAGVAVGSVVGLVLVGGIWPTILTMLVGGGFGPAPRSEEEKAAEKAMKARAAASKPEPQKVKPVVSAAEQAKLDALNDKLERDLAASGVLRKGGGSAMNDDSTAGAPAITQLRGGADASETPRPAGQPDEEKDFSAGVFYPVARTHAKPNDPPAAKSGKH